MKDNCSEKTYNLLGVTKNKINNLYKDEIKKRNILITKLSQI